MTITAARLTCTNCKHHMYDHKFADPKVLTKKERKSGAIPWYCAVDECECQEFFPGK